MKGVKGTTPVYRETLFRIFEERNIGVTDMSVRLGYSKNWISGKFSEHGGEVAYFPNVALVAICSLLAVKMEDLTKEPPRAKQKAPEAQGRQDADAGELLKAVKSLENTLREATSLLHGDLRALLAEWKPKPEQIRIGGEASK